VFFAVSAAPPRVDHPDIPRYDRRKLCDALNSQAHTPRLSIGLPVYNGEVYLAQAIEALLAQTFTDFRLIVSDNGSSDATEEICRSYARRDPRIDYHRSPENRGGAWNFNRVVELADSELFKWAAYDDLHAPQCVERCVSELDAHPQAIGCYPAAHIIDERSAIVSTHREPPGATRPVPSERFKTVLWHWGYGLILFAVFRLAALRQTQLHGAYPASDLVLLAEIALRGPLCAVDEPLFLWRDHARRPTRVCTSDEELAVWYAPDNAGRRQFRHLQLFANYLRTIARVPLGLDQKLRCWGSMARWFLVRFPTIQDEIRGNLAGPVRRAWRRWTPGSRSDSTPRAT
jgi:glycosyltransferase involved in cell wall biosynthesis